MEYVMAKRIVECAGCGAVFEAQRKTAKWCSNRCAVKAWEARHPKLAKPVRKLVCEQCSGAFETTKNRKRRFCSPECNIAAQNAARETTQDEWRTCIVCERAFQPKQIRGVGRSYCSDTCRGKARYRRRKFGTSQKYYADYDALFEKQDGKCGICGEPETIKDGRNGKRKKLALDHCHSSGKLRGLLCTGCNTGLGCFADDRTRLSAAITYLDKFT